MVRLMGPSTCDTNNLHKFLPLVERFLRGGPFLLPPGGNRNAKMPVVKGLNWRMKLRFKAEAEIKS